MPRTFRRVQMLVLGAGFCVQIAAGPSTPAAVTRCGWFSNPTPANAWLLDRDAEWTIGVQGGAQADGD